MCGSGWGLGWLGEEGVTPLTLQKRSHAFKASQISEIVKYYKVLSDNC